MTPRQTQAFLRLAEAHRREELGELLAIQSLAASGDGEAIRTQLKQLGIEG